jgi:hypothetical protein
MKMEPYGAGWIAEPELLERELANARALGIEEERALWEEQLEQLRKLRPFAGNSSDYNDGYCRAMRHAIAIMSGKDELTLKPSFAVGIKAQQGAEPFYVIARGKADHWVAGPEKSAAILFAFSGEDGDQIFWCEYGRTVAMLAIWRDGQWYRVIADGESGGMP